MEDILGQLIIDFIFAIEEEDFEDMLNGSGIKPRESYDDDTSVLIRRRRLREKRTSEHGTATLSSDMESITIDDSPKNLIAFLRYLSEYSQSEGGLKTKIVQGISSFKYYLLDYILEGSMIEASKRHNLTKPMPSLEKILGFNPINASLDFFHPEVNRQKWFHLTVQPATNRPHKTSVRLVLSRTIIEEMIDVIEDVPRIIGEIQALLGP